MTTSPPAQKPRPSAWSMTTISIAASSRHLSSASLHGGYGYLMDYPIERFWRDLRVHSILEGTNQIMRVIVSRDLLRQ
jgi:alkylation response protein AidB-like acyl-CoA dehydrogenase